MAARLAPYLRYCSSKRPIEDHGAPPLVLVVFEDPLAADHFMQVARDEAQRVGVAPPLFASDRRLLDQRNPLGPAWRRYDDWQRLTAFAFDDGRS